MTSSNFMLSDLIGTSAAFFIFSLFLLVPGYFCGWLIDAFGFRRRTLVPRLAASVSLSIGISPVVAYLSWHVSLLAVWAVFGFMWIGFLGLLIHERRLWLSRPLVSKRQAAFIAITVGWIVLGIFCLIDLQFNDRLYFSFLAHDYTLRAAITASITRSGVPPHNPYFFPGHPVSLRYHYFWFILCSLVEQIGRPVITPRQGMLAGTLWSGFGLIAVIPLYLRFFQPKGAINLERRMLIGVGLLAVTGLDILPITLLDAFNRTILPSVDFWNNPVVAWIGEVLWAPHQVAALVACLTAFLLIWQRRGVPGMLGDTLASVLAGAMFASAVGLSVYVTLTFAAFLGIWMVVCTVTKRFSDVRIICVAGFVSALICLPYLFELRGGHAGQNVGGGHFLQFTIRSFPILELVVSAVQPTRQWLIPVMNALALPLNYLLELGFFFLVGVEQCRRMRASKSFFGHRELCGVVMAGTSVVLCTFFRSGVITANDLGMRGFMIAQFVLLLWGTELLDEGLLSQARLGTHSTKLIAATLVLGVAGTLYELCAVRFFTLLPDDTAMSTYPWLTSDRQLGRRTYALRELYEALQNTLPTNAVMQHNPRTNPGDLFYGLYADRQVAAETLQCGTVFGGDPALCTKIIGPIEDLFEKPGAVDTDQVDAVCTALSINALIVKDTDAVWADKNSWVWKKQPVISNRYARAFLCGRAHDPGVY